jgi:RNA polymerase sigma factor (sigma-70 family)
MAPASLGAVVRHLHQLADGRGSQSPDLSDRQLLEAFSAGKDQAAFEALVRRHGPLVLGVCRHLLRHEQDAEDAFQNTFLALASNAPSIRKQDSLAGWLHSVAYRVSIRAKRDAVRRRRRERRSGAATLAASLAPALRKPFWEAAWREVQAVLDEEVRRLPEKYRTAFVLCCLEGQGRSETARQLGLK